MRNEQRPRGRVNRQPFRRLTLLIGVGSAVSICSLLSATVAWSAPQTVDVARAAATDIYQYAGECVTVRDQRSNRYVVREAEGYALHSRAGAATPFRMQATDLGSYLLYGPDARTTSTRNSRAPAGASSES